MIIHNHIHSSHFIRYILSSPLTSLHPITSSSLRGIYLTMCWKYCSEILVQINMKPVPAHPKDAILGRDLMTVKAVCLYLSFICFVGVFFTSNSDPTIQISQHKLKFSKTTQLSPPNILLSSYSLSF